MTDERHPHGFQPPHPEPAGARRHARRQARFERRFAVLAELRRRHPKRLGEGPGKRLVGFIPRLEGNLQHRVFRAPQLPCGPLQPQAPHVLPHRFAHHAPKDPVEVKRREARHPGQFLERQGTVQVLLDVRQHLRDAFAIGVHRAGLHEFESSLTGRACLDRFCGNCRQAKPPLPGRAKPADWRCRGSRAGRSEATFCAIRTKSHGLAGDWGRRCERRHNEPAGCLLCTARGLPPRRRVRNMEVDSLALCGAGVSTCGPAQGAPRNRPASAPVPASEGGLPARRRLTTCPTRALRTRRGGTLGFEPFARSNPATPPLSGGVRSPL